MKESTMKNEKKTEMKLDEEILAFQTQTVCFQSVTPPILHHCQTLLHLDNNCFW